MAEQGEESSGPIKTPKQLIVVVVIALFLPVAVAVMFSQLATSGRSRGDLSEEAVARRIQPMARVELAPAAASPAASPAAAPAPAAATSATAAPAPAATGPGKKVYDGACVACHATGVAGAPKFGDKAAWAPRLATGLDALTASAIKGKGAMPPKGGNTSIPDADIRAAVEYMTTAAK